MVNRNIELYIVGKVEVELILCCVCDVYVLYLLFLRLMCGALACTKAIY